MKEEKQSYPLRLPTALRQALEKSAKKSRRSLHAEIILRLEQSFIAEGKPVEKKGKQAITIYPGRIGEERSEYSAQGVDLKALTIVIAKGEAYIESMGPKLDAEKRAKLYDAMYAICEGKIPCNLPDETIEKLIRLAS